MAVTDSVQPLISISTPTVSNLQNLVVPSNPMGLICDAFPTLLCQETLNLVSNPDFTASASAPLDPYVGETGTVTGTVNANFSPLQLTPPEIGSLNSSTVTESAQLSGQLNITYSYLNHAQPAFVPSNTQTATLKFGTVLQGSKVPTQQWGATNVGSAPNIGLDLISASSVNPKLDLGITQPLIGLDTGLAQVYNATLDTAQPGSANTSYQLAFSDSAKGVAASRNTYQMALNVTGNVLVRTPSLKPNPLVTSFHPATPVSADLNRDGKPDLLVLDRDHANIVAYRGDSTAKFVNTFQAKVGLNPVALVVGDINRDGKPDLVVANISDSTVQVMLGDGGGKFNAGTAYNAGSTPYGLAVGDINRDGKPDVAVTNPGLNQVNVLLGNGDGVLQAPRGFAVGNNPLSLTMTDVGGDGKPDLVVANNGGSNLSLLRGTGANGLFAVPVTIPLVAGTNPSTVTAADMNKDGHPDLVVANSNLNSVSVLANKGKGTFAAPVSVPVGIQPSGIAVADFNADSKPDLTVANTADTSLHTVLNTTVVAPSGRFADAVGSPIGVPNSIASILEDINRDGRNDLITNSDRNRTISVSLGYGDGRFLPIPGLTIPDVPTSVISGDMNGDGKPDLAVRVSKGSAIYTYLGRGNGSFQSASLISIPPVQLNASVLRLGDVNGDGKLDLVAGSDSGDWVYVALGNGDGSFKAPVSYPTGGTVHFPLISSIALGDINGDGKADLAVTNLYGASVLLGNGDGSFQPAILYVLDNIGNLTRALALGDINRDGNLDLLVQSWAANNSTNLAVLLGNGNGSFQNTQYYAMDIPLPIQFTLGDVNGDNKLDLLSLNNGIKDSFGVLLGNGDGSFKPFQAFVNGTLGYSMAIGDVNGDSRPDFVVPNLVASSVSVLLNRAP